jgi:antitoxin HicB
LVTCPALPEVSTFGEDEAEAVHHARDAIEEAIAARMADGREVPEPRGKRGVLVALPMQTSLKVELYRLLKRENITRAELMRRPELETRIGRSALSPGPRDSSSSTPRSAPWGVRLKSLCDEFIEPARRHLTVRLLLLCWCRMTCRKGKVAVNYSFSVILEPQDGGGFTILVPALPEIVTEGETEEEALANAEEAIRAVLAYRQEHGFGIPSDAYPEIRRVTVAA